jgi:hypothetical protein
MKDTATVPAFSPFLDSCPEHAWVFGPAGSQLITARSFSRRCIYDAEYMSELHSPFISIA